MYVGEMHIDEDDGGNHVPPPPPPPRRPFRRHLGELQLIDSDEEDQRMGDPQVLENRRQRPRNPRRHINRLARHHPHLHPLHHPYRHRFALDNAVNMRQDDINGNNDIDDEPMFQVFYRQPEQPHEVPQEDDNIEMDDIEIDEEDDDVFVAPGQQEVPQNYRRRNLRRRRRSSGSGVRHMRICG